MSGDSSDDGLLEEMDRVRGELGGGINKLGEQMREMFDWQSYVRSAPLTSVAVAAAAGFLIAPRRRATRLVVNATPDTNLTGSMAGGIVGSIMNVIVATATQAASLYVADLLTKELLSPPESSSAFDDENVLDPTFDQGD